MMIELARRQRSQPAPPKILFEMLSDPTGPNVRPWLREKLAERAPIVRADAQSSSVVWTSLWADHPDVEIHFRITEHQKGSMLTWALMGPKTTNIDFPALGQMTSDLNKLINRDLRLSLGQ